MIGWLLGQTVRRAGHRLALGTLGVAFPVAMLLATLAYADRAVTSMTRVALEPVQVEQRALATSLNVDLTSLRPRLKAVPGVTSVDRFAAADVVVRPNGTGSGAYSARLFAVDPAYLTDHPWVRVGSGALGRGALLDQTLRSASPELAAAKSVTIELPGGGNRSLAMSVGGTADLRTALPTWFAIPAGDVQGDIALVPRAVVVPYDTFARVLLPALRAKLGPTTPVLNPGLTDLPPVSLEAHIGVDHKAYPSDPGAATVWSDALRHILERRAPTGSVVVTDQAAEPLLEASSDATNAKILFFLLGLPGALIAAALGLAAQSALAEAQRREDSLLRLRGATERQVVSFGAAQAAVTGAIGSIVGVAAGLAAASAVVGDAAWHDVATSSLLTAIFISVGVGAATTAVRILLLIRANRRADLVTERWLLENGWRPLWLRARLDILAITVGVVILAGNLATGGLRPDPVPASQGATLGLSFYVLLAPLLIWLGVSLFVVRSLVAAARRWARPERSRSMPTWSATTLRWLARRPARAGVALVLGTLAIAFGTEVTAFVATFGAAKHADAVASFGSDLRLTPGDPLNPLPKLGSSVTSTTPMRAVPSRVGSDRKTILAIDLSSYLKTVTSAPNIAQGQGLEALRRDRWAVIVAQEIAADLGVKVGDNLPLTLFPDDVDKSRNIALHVAGVFRSFAPSNPFAELVTSTAALPPYLIPQPDFYMGKVAPGLSPEVVGAEIATRPDMRRTYAVTTFAQQSLAGARSLTTINVAGLQRIEVVGTALAGALGVAVLGGFIVLERRREFGVLEAIGTGPMQLLAAPAQEATVAVLGSLVIGIPLGLLLSVLAIRVLGLFFTLPPPLLAVDGVALLVLAALMIGASAAALAASLARVRRINPAVELRST